MSGCACVRPGLQMEAVRMEVSLHSFFLLMLQFKKETHYEKIKNNTILLLNWYKCFELMLANLK